jgi:hypothetical protein
VAVGAAVAAEPRVVAVAVVRSLVVVRKAAGREAERAVGPAARVARCSYS